MSTLGDQSVELGDFLLRELFSDAKGNSRSVLSSRVLSGTIASTRLTHVDAVERFGDDRAQFLRCQRKRGRGRARLPSDMIAVVISLVA